MLIYAEFFSNQLVKYIVLNDVKTFNKVRTLGRKKRYVHTTMIFKQ